jgi:hypothetical protein
LGAWVNNFLRIPPCFAVQVNASLITVWPFSIGNDSLMRWKHEWYETTGGMKCASKNQGREDRHIFPALLVNQAAVSPAGGGSGLYGHSLFIFKTARHDHDEIDQDPDSQATERQELYNPGTVSTITSLQELFNAPLVQDSR